MQPFESVANCLLPCMSYQSFEIFEVSTSDFSTMSMHRRFRAYEFLTTVTEGVVHDAHKVSKSISRFDEGELRLIEVASR